LFKRPSDFLLKQLKNARAHSSAENELSANLLFFHSTVELRFHIIHAGDEAREFKAITLTSSWT
jgi:hypothetical protein